MVKREKLFEKLFKLICWQAIDSCGSLSTATCREKFAEGICIAPVIKWGTDTNPQGIVLVFRDHRMGGFWYTLADGGQQKLYDYVYEYLAIAGAEIATMIAESVHRSSADAVREALDNAEAAGCEELFVVPATAELSEIDRLSELLAQR